MHRFLLIVGLLFAAKPCLGEDLSTGQDQETTGTLRTMLVLLDTEDPAAAAQNRQFATELRLVLDEFDVVLAEVSSADYKKTQLPDQMESVRLIATKYNVSLVSWIEPSASGTLVLHMVFLGTGRAVVRTVDAVSGPGAEAGLAIAARELLEDVALVNTAEPSPDTAGSSTKTPGPPVVLEEGKPRAKQSRLALMAAAQGSGGVAMGEGPSAHLGGLVGTRLWPNGQRWHLALSLGFGAGPIGDAPQAAISGWRLEPAFQLGYQREVGRFHLGPLLGVSAPYSSATFELEGSAPETVSWWNCRIFGGAGFRIDLGEVVSLLLDGSIGFYTNKEIFQEVAKEGATLENPNDNNVTMKTPTFDWNALIGLEFFVL